jgi:hypothetical protein
LSPFKIRAIRRFAMSRRPLAVGRRRTIHSIVTTLTMDTCESQGDMWGSLTGTDGSEAVPSSASARFRYSAYCQKKLKDMCGRPSFAAAADSAILADNRTGTAALSSATKSLRLRHNSVILNESGSVLRAEPVGQVVYKHPCLRTDPLLLQHPCRRPTPLLNYETLVAGCLAVGRPLGVSRGSAVDSFLAFPFEACRPRNTATP